MTEAESPQSAKAGARRPGRRPSFVPVFWSSLALFAVLFAVLTYQMSTASTPQAPPVLVRKVIKRRIVTTIVPGPGATSVSAGSVSSSGAALAAAPVTTGAS